MGSTSFNVRTLRTTPKADPPPGLVWQSGGPDQKLDVTDIGFVFFKIFEHAYLACVRRAKRALRFEGSTLHMGRIGHKPPSHHVFFSPTSRGKFLDLRPALERARRAAYDRRVFCERTPTVNEKKRKKKSCQIYFFRPRKIQ